jgi:long-chain acyl-CoA synthetase
MLTHRNLYASADAAAEASEMHNFTGPRISITALPMAHIFGVGVMNSGYLVSGAVADSYWVQMAWFDPEKCLQLIQQHRCNSMAGVPAMFIFLLNHPKVDEYDLSSLDEVVSGAAPLPVEIATAFQKKWNCRIREIYGQTESTGLGSANRLSLPYKPGSAGKAYYNTELKIFDDHDEPVPTGEKGEIVLRGPAIMKGYFNNPEATAEALRGGWLHTGDIGYLDEEGYLFIVDRKKDLIIKAGENIYPAELEEILYSLPGVAEAAVVGKPDAVLGEVVIAYLVLKPGFRLTDVQVKDFFKGKTSSFKSPSEVLFIDALPKSPVGKILKRELREKASKG